MAADGQVFRPWVVIALAVGGTIAFAAMLTLLATGEDFRTRGSNNSFSESALGHNALFELLERLEIPVETNRGALDDRARKAGLVVVAEPTIADAAAAIAPLLAADQLLFVLPKRRGLRWNSSSNWEDEVYLLPAEQVQQAFDLIALDGEVVRRTAVSTWPVNRLGTAPTLTEPQLLRSPDVTPIVASDDGILLGRVNTGTGQDLWVLSDPDLLANHGLDDGDNAIAAVAMISQLLPAGGPVVFDETVHGFELQRSFWSALFELPLVVCTIQIAVLLVVLGLVATGRFGTPRPPSPAIQPGKAALIDNMARLLQLGQGQRSLVERYAALVLQSVARRRHAPRGLSEEALAGRLDPGGRYAWLRGLLQAGAASPQRLLQLAQGFAAWRQDFGQQGASNGSGRR